VRGPRSLQARIALAVGLSVSVLWLAAAALTAQNLGREMDSVFDSALRDAARRLLPLAIHGGRERRGHGGDERRDRGDREERVARLHEEDDLYTYVVRDGRGRVLLASEDAREMDFPPYSGDGFRQTDTLRLYYDRAAREDVTIAVAEPLARRRAVSRAMMVNLALPLLIVIPLSLGAILLAVRSSLGPIRQLRRNLGRRGARNLAPLDDAGLPGELRPIVGSVNALMQRLSAAFEAERSFAANAAHELRTPVAGAIAQAQRLRTETGDAAAAARATEIETTLKRLNRLSEKLMQLARAEGARLRVTEPADIRPVLRIVVGDLERLDGAGRVALSLPDAPVMSDLDPDAFGILCRNLVENALKHGAPGTPIEVNLSPGGVLAVRNAGPVIPPQELERLGARFVRSSNGKGDGTGLGLAIVGTIAERVSGKLDLRSPAPGRPDGFEAAFTLPDPQGG